MIYAISDGRAIKFGFARDVDLRMRGLSTGHYRPLQIVATCDATLLMEKHLHGLLKEKLPQKVLLYGEWYADHAIVERTVSAIKTATLIDHFAWLNSLTESDIVPPALSFDERLTIAEKSADAFRNALREMADALEILGKIVSDEYKFNAEINEIIKRRKRQVSLLLPKVTEKIIQAGARKERLDLELSKCLE